MIFKPKISHQKPIKPPLKADFNAYFTKKRMIFTPIYKICATPKGPFRVRFPAGVPNKKEPTGSFLFGFRCGSEPVVRPIAQQWHEERSDEVFPAATSFKKSLRALFCLAFDAETNPRFAPLRTNGTKSYAVAVPDAARHV